MSPSDSDDQEDEYLREGNLVADASLHPPVLLGGAGGDGQADPDAPLPGSVVLEYLAYFDERTNATTAYSKTRGGDHTIQVTFWPAHPPRLSYFTVWCPDLKPGDFAEEPVIMAAEEDLVLLRVILGTRCATTSRENYDFFVYHAGAGKPPSLELLKHPGPSRIFHDTQVGLLRCRSPDSHGMPILRPHGFQEHHGGHYMVAALVTAFEPGHRYRLHTYDSRTREWATRTAVLMRPDDQECHGVTTKVIVVGGEAGTMGWADLWRGILFCDLLLLEDEEDREVQLRFVALPPPIMPGKVFQGCPGIARDVALVRGRINYVELQIHVRPGSVADGNFITDDWTVATWFMKATAQSLEKGSWQPSYRVNASQIIRPRKNLELLPKLLDNQGRPQPTLQRLHTGHPRLSLHEDDVVYIMTKARWFKDTKGWGLAVNLRNKTLQRVVPFDAKRIIGASLPVMCCGISEHLQLAPDDHTLPEHC